MFAALWKDTRSSASPRNVFTRLLVDLHTSTQTLLAQANPKGFYSLICIAATWGYLILWNRPDFDQATWLTSGFSVGLDVTGATWSLSSILCAEGRSFRQARYAKNVTYF